MPIRKTRAATDRDNPQWTKRDFARATSFPAGTGIAKATNEMMKRRGRPKIENPKEAIKLRIDQDVLAAYRKTGEGWQTRINSDLRKARRLKAG